MVSDIKNARNTKKNHTRNNLSKIKHPSDQNVNDNRLSFSFGTQKCVTKTHKASARIAKKC